MNTNQSRHAMHSRAPQRRRPEASAISGDETIHTIRAGQGAKVTTRHNAAEAAGRARHNAEERYFERHPEARGPVDGPERSKKNILLLVLAGVLVLVVVFFVGRCVGSALAGDPGQTDQQVVQGQGGEPSRPEDAATEQADPTGAVSYQGVTYALAQQESGRMGLVATFESGEQDVLFEVEGTPAALMRHGGTLLVPENRNGGWDVVCYVIGGHSEVSYITTMDGAMVSGSGDITSAQLDGDVIHVTDSTGASTDVAVS